MNQLLKNFIPLGDTGNICYLQGTLKDFDSNDNNLIQAQLLEFKAKKIQKLILLRSLTKQINFDSISSLLKTNGFQFSIYTPNSEYRNQVELFESIFDSNEQGNICILFFGISPALLELTIKLILYLNSNVQIEEIYQYLTNDEPDIITLNEFKSYLDFLENDPYLITKPDRTEFKKSETHVLFNGVKPTLSTKELNTNTTNTPIPLNLSSLKGNVPDNEYLLTETEAINFNLNSLVESDFEKEESPEEHYQKSKESARKEYDDSLSLDVDLLEEIEYITSLESLAPPTKDKISVINIDTIPLETVASTKAPIPTIDYKSKDFLDFDAIIEEEIEQGMLTDELSENCNLPSSVSYPDDLDLNIKSLDEETENGFSFNNDLTQEDAVINLNSVDVKANVDLSFPSPLQNLEDFLDKGLGNVTEEGMENFVDPSQTFMVKRINDVIKKEVLNEESKGKIPVSDLIKVDTKNSEIIKKNTLPTIPKITNPKFNPITLDD